MDVAQKVIYPGYTLQIVTHKNTRYRTPVSIFFQADGMECSESFARRAPRIISRSRFRPANILGKKGTALLNFLRHFTEGPHYTSVLKAASIIRVYCLFLLSSPRSFGLSLGSFKLVAAMLNLLA